MKISFFSNHIFRIPTFTFSEKNLISKTDESIKSHLFSYSLLLSSPTLYSQLHISDSDEEKMQSTLLKYSSRMSYRTIPFGLFSGIGMLSSNYEKNSDGKLVIEKLFTSTTLDSNIKYKINRNKLSTADLLDLKITLNPTLMFRNGVYRYIKFTIEENGGYKYEYISFDSDEYLSLIFTAIKNGEDIKAVINILVNDDIEFDDAYNFIDELVINKILISNLEPTTIDFDDDFNIGKYKINKLLHNFNKLDFYKKSRIQNVIHKKQVEKGNISPTDDLLYVNTFFSSKSAFSNNQDLLLKQAINTLDTILLRFKREEYVAIDNLKNEIEKRFEGGTISIIDVFDPEKGFVYPKADKTHFEIEAMDRFFLTKINKDINAKILKITEFEFNQISELPETHSTNKSPTGCARFSLYQKQNSDFIHIKSLSAHSPNRVISRFTNSNESLNYLSKEIADYEAEMFSGIILAELDFLPNIYQGNILNRSKFHKYRIVIHSKENSEYCIPINDLYLKIYNNQIVIVSKKFNKQVIPCLTSSWNPEGSNILPMCKFLIDYYYSQFNRTSAILNIHKYHTYHNHIPRLMYKNIVLSKESWKVNVHDFIYIDKFKNEYDKKDIENAVQLFDINRKKLNIPPCFEFITNDIETYINSDNKIMVKLFLKELNKRKELILSESLIKNYNSTIVSNNKEQYNNEFFAFFKNKNFEKSLTDIVFKVENLIYKSKYFIPGSDWVYYKIYLNQQYSSKFLILVNKIMESMISKNEINKYFYLMFFDSDFHIRIRIDIEKKDYNTINQNFTKFLSKLYEKQFLKTISIETYVREIERYGKNNMNYIENIFFIDSEISLKIIQNSFNHSVEGWVYSVTLCNIYMDMIFKSDEIQDKLFFIREMKNNLSFRVNNHNSTKTAWVNAKYNYNIENISIIFSKKHEFISDKNFKQIVSSFTKLNLSQKLTKKYFLGNIIHMHITRITNKENLLYEFLVYSILDKMISKKIYNIQKSDV